MATAVPVRMATLVMALVVLVASRFPGDAPWGILAVIGGVLAIAVSAWSLSSRAPVGTRTTAVLLAMLLLLVPPSEQALLAGSPDAAVAILFLIALHVFFTSQDAGAPKVGSAAGRHWYQEAYRLVPAVLAVAALLAAPWLSKIFLPPRIHAAYELQTALQPVAFLAIMAAALVTGSLLWTAFDSTIKTDKTGAGASTREERSDAVPGGEA